MSAPFHYRTMRFSIPEGGEVVLHVPSHISSDSLDMAGKCIDLQLKIFRRHSDNAIENDQQAKPEVGNG